MTIKNKYELGQLVFLVTDPDQLPRMVIQVGKNITGGVLYVLACGSDEPAEFFEDEIQDERSVI
jgi:hypothetical protein